MNEQAIIRTVEEQKEDIRKEFEAKGYRVVDIKEDCSTYTVEVLPLDGCSGNEDETNIGRRRPDPPMRMGTPVGHGTAAAMLALAMGSPDILSDGPFRRSRLSPYSNTPDTNPEGVRRNESCPCGSGRKFKRCCKVKKAGVK